MENNISQIQTLYNKWVSKTASEEEGQLLYKLIQEQPYEVTPMLKQTWEQLISEEHTFEEHHRSILQAIVSQYPATPIDEKASVRLVPPSYRWLAAAVFILSLGAGIYYFAKTGRQQQQPAETAQSVDIAPGHSGAMLTLADGSQVALDSIKNGAVAIQGGATAKIVNGVLLYEGSGSNVVYNTMSTPRGRQFHIILPDGTRVWLNASSSIRYPTVFAGNERKVEITGEAYVEVAANEKMPFRLNINDQANIEVLGTHFNVNAYNDEESINTTLIEGSVKVSVPSAPSSAAILRPGQQAQMLKDGRKANGMKIIRNANIETILAWKNGFFNFEDVPFEEAMRQLERWYDIEVVYESKVPDIQFEGKMTRDFPLSGLLIALERSDVHFRIEGRKLIVLP